MLLASMLPSIDFDVLEYHLQGPKEYFQAGRIAYLPHNVYTNMPFNVEMLHLLAMEVMGDWWWGGLAGQLLVAFFGPAAAVLIAGTAARGGSARAGWIAALVYLSTPWIYRLAAIAYVEGPLCFYHAALIFVAVILLAKIGDKTARVEPERERGSGGPRLSSKVAKRAGGVLQQACWAAGDCWDFSQAVRWAASTPGLVSAVIPFGLFSLLYAWRNRSIAVVACFVDRMGDCDGSLACEKRGRYEEPGVSACGDRFSEPGLEQRRGRNNGRRARAEADRVSRDAQFTCQDGGAARSWSRDSFRAPRQLWARSLTWRGGPTGSRRSMSRWRRWRSSSRLAATGALALVVRGVSLLHVVDRDAPAGSVLASDAAGPGDSRRAGRGLDAKPELVGRAGHRRCDRAFCERDVHHDGPCGAQRVDGRPGRSCVVSFPGAGTGPMARMDSELPDGARPLMVGQAAVFHLNHTVAYNTVFNPETIEMLAKGKSAEELRQCARGQEASPTCTSTGRRSDGIASRVDTASPAL